MEQFIRDLLEGAPYNLDPAVALAVAQEIEALPVKNNAAVSRRLAGQLNGLAQEHQATTTIVDAYADHAAQAQLTPKEHKKSAELYRKAPKYGNSLSGDSEIKTRSVSEGEDVYRDNFDGARRTIAIMAACICMAVGLYLGYYLLGTPSTTATLPSPAITKVMTVPQPMNVEFNCGPGVECKISRE